MENKGLYVLEDEDLPSTSSDRTVRRPSGGIHGKVHVDDSGVILILDSDSDSDDVPVKYEKDSPDFPSASAKDVSSDSDSDLPDVFARDGDSNKDCRDTSDLPSTSKGKGRGLGYMKGHGEELPSPKVKGKTIKVESNVRRQEDNSSGEAQVFKQEREADDDGDKRSGRIVGNTVDSDSADEAGEKTQGVGEEDVQFGDDYNVEDGAGNLKEQDGQGNIDEDPGDSTGNGMTLGDLWAGMPSDSQVEPKTYDFVDTHWTQEDTSSPGANPAWESQVCPVSPVECASPVPRKESPSPQDPLSNSSDRDDANVGGDVPSTSNADSRCPGSPSTKFLLKQALRSTHRMDLKIYKVPLPSDFENMSNELDSDPGPAPAPVYYRPRKNHTAFKRKHRRREHDSSDESSSADEEEQSSHDVSTELDTGRGKQSNARRKMIRMKRKARRDRRGQEKKRKVAGTSRRQSSSSEPDQDSTDDNLLHEEQCQEQSKMKDRLSHKSPSSRLDEGTAEEPMDIASDEEVHKEGRRLVSRKAPVVSESGTDSDETCIDEDDLEEATRQARNITEEPHSSNEISVDTDDGHDCHHKLVSTDVKTSTVEKGRGNAAKASSGEVREEVTIVRNSAMSPGATTTGRVTLTLPLRPVKMQSRSQKIESKRAEDDAPKEGKSNMVHKDHPGTKKARGKTNKKVVSSPDEIKTETFYGTSKVTKVSRESGSSSSARAESWDEVLRSAGEEPEDLCTNKSLTATPSSTVIEESDKEEVAYPESQPFSVAEEIEEISDSEYFNTQPFSPMDNVDDSENVTTDADDELHVGTSRTNEDLYTDTQPFSPEFESDSENLSTSETPVGNDALSNNGEDSTCRKKAIAQEVREYFPADPQISSLGSDEEACQSRTDGADSETVLANRSSEENAPKKNSYTEQYFPTDSQLSSSLDSEDIERPDSQQRQKPVEDTSCGQYFPTDSQLSIDLESEDTEELASHHEEETVPHGEEAESAIPAKGHSSSRLSKDLDESGGKKILPCQRNAWSPSDLDPQQRFLLLQEGESESVSFSQESGYTGMPPSPADTPSTSSAVPCNPIVSTHNEKLSKTSRSLQRPSRSDNLLQTMKQTDQQKKKPLMKNTIPTQDTPDPPNNPPIPKDPSVKPSTSSVNSLQDGPQQPASVSSSKMDPENAVTATTSIFVNGHSSAPNVSSPSQSSSAAYVTASHAPACNTRPNVMKSSGDGQFVCPSGPSNSSLVASDTGKPLKKRRLSQTSNIPHGSQRTEPSEATLHNKELKKEDILSCILSWNTDWYEKHKEVHSAEVLQSFLFCKTLPESRKSYQDVRSYQVAFISFLLMEMWSKVSGSAAKDCPGIWRQNSRVNDLSSDIIEVHYEADDNQTGSHGLNEGDLVLLDMTTVNAQNQFQFGLVQGNGLSNRTICLALHKTMIVPSSTRLKIVTSLKHHLNQITALLSFHSHPLARHVIKPDVSPVFAKETQKVLVTNDELIKSYMDCFKDTGSKSEVIRLMNGPPGTGKTTFLHRLVRWITRIDKDVPKTMKNPHKLLVCAPTSQSLDVLLRKIWDALLKHKAPSVRDAEKNVVDGVEVVRVGQTEEADYRLTDFFLSTVVTRMREQGSPYDKLSEDELQTKILQRADVVGCTLEDCGMNIVRRSLEGNVFALVVDDASHCLETEILLALQCKTKRLFMAGDQEQGIINIRSKESKDLGFGRSMLERMAENFEMQDRRIHRWETQYRMKEEIAKFPSSYIYLHRLKTEKDQPFFLRPYIIFDVADGKESLDRDLVVNNSEVSFISELLSVASRVGKLTSLGIITPSVGQKAKLLERLQRRHIEALLIGTPTEFYGVEKDVIILCCTSTSKQTADDTGFLMNKQILNLALTRARFSLIIVGNMKSVQKMSSDWEYLVNDAIGRQLVFRTMQASYITDAKHCLSGDGMNGHSDKTSSRPSASSSRPEQQPAMYSNKPQRNAFEGRHPSENQHGGRHDGPSRQREDSFRHRHNPGPRDNPAHGRCFDPMEADAVMPSGVNSLPPDLDSGRRSPLALLNGANARVELGERPVHVPPRDILPNQPSLANQDLFGGAEQNHPLRHRHISGDGADVARGRKRVHFEPGTKDDASAAKLPRLMNASQGKSSSAEVPSGISSKPRQSWPSSRGSAQTQSILKKPEQAVAGPSYSCSREGAVSNHKDHNLRNHEGSSTVPDRSISNTGSSQRLRRNSQLPDSSLDSDNGKKLHAIATGMMDNERVSRQQKGKNIAGRNFDRRLPQRSGRRDSNEDRNRRERRPSGEGTSGHNINMSSSRRDSNETRNRRERRPSGEGTSGHNINMSSSRRDSNEERNKREGRLSGEGTSNGHLVSNENGWRQNPDEQHLQQDGSNPQPPRHYRQQQQQQPLPERYVQRITNLTRFANSPAKLDRGMQHNRTVHEAFGNRSTALTEPQPNNRRRKRSNSVKDREMDYAY